MLINYAIKQSLQYTTLQQSAPPSQIESTTVDFISAKKALMIEKNTLQTLVVTLIAACMMSTVNGDCPIENYPQDTIIGFVNAEFSLSPNLEEKSKENYIYSMEEALTTATPNVLVGVNSLNYDLESSLNFKVLYQPTPRFGTLRFDVYAPFDQNRWKRIQFNFIATNNRNLRADSIDFQGLSLEKAGAHSLVSRIQIDDTFKSQRSPPLILTFIAGIETRAKMTQADLQQALQQVQTLRRFSWNVNLLKMINQMIETQSEVYFQLTDSSLSGDTLALSLTISDSIRVGSLTVSYLIVNSEEFPLQNNILTPSFPLSSEVQKFGFSPLDSTDMTFIGIEGIRHFINSAINFEFVVEEGRGQNSFEVSLLEKLPEKYSLFTSVVQMEIRKEFQCQGCPQSPYRFENFCLSTCPRNYVNILNGTESRCEYCNLTEFWIPNQSKTQCVCAQQYFYNRRSEECQACHYSCLTCDNNRTCLTCDNPAVPLTRRILNRASQCSCTDGYFDNFALQNLICEKCHNSCLTCTGPSIYQCKSCQVGRQLDVTGRCSCPQLFEDVNGECLCQEPNLLLQGVCYGVNSAEDACEGANRVESPINSRNGRTVCQCKEGYSEYENECIKCPQTFVLNSKTGRCECNETSFLNSEGSCTSCEPMKYYDLKFEKCLCRKQFFETSDGGCIDCPDKSSYENGKCQCVFNYYLRNGQCVKCRKTEDDPNCNRVEIDEL